MAQLEVNFTIKGELSETTFKLIKYDGHFGIKGISEISGPKEYSLEYLDDEDTKTRTFVLKDKNNSFTEDIEVIEERLLALSEEYISASSDGFELDDDIEEHCIKETYSPDEIYVENKPFSISTIIELINDGDLEISPKFQRRIVWDRTRQSKLIESILLGFPIPAVYLSQYSDGRLTIVDGLQRITTIQRFMDDKLVLCNMEYLKDCNGKRYSELKDILPLLQFRRFRQTQIMCFVIDYRSPNALKFDLFRRLNTGGIKLNDQEIRNCLSRPTLQKLLSEMVKTDEFKRATGGSINDKRMAAQESVLRFIYFYDQYSDEKPIGDYTGNMGECLDTYVGKLNYLSEDKLWSYIELFKKSMQMAFCLFGEFTFRKVEIGSKKKNAINKPLMLAITVLLAHHYEKYREKVDLGAQLINELSNLLKVNQKLAKVITTSTTHKTSISYTMSTLRTELFDKYLQK